MIFKDLLVLDFDGTIVEEDSVARVLKILPREIRKHGFSHYVDLFQHTSKKVNKMLLFHPLDLLFMKVEVFSMNYEVLLVGINNLNLTH